MREQSMRRDLWSAEQFGKPFGGLAVGFLSTYTDHLRYPQELLTAAPVGGALLTGSKQ